MGKGKDRQDGLGRAEKWLLAGIALLALSLRIWGIGTGLPYLYHPDEAGKVCIAQRMLKTGDLNPHYFRKPGLFIYLNALAYVPYYLTGRLLGIFQQPNDVPYPNVIAMAVGKTSMSTTFLLGRVLSACFGVGAVAMVYLAGRQLAKKGPTGLLAALMMAISPASVLNSRHIHPDAQVVFFIVLSLWLSLRLLERGKAWDYVLAGLAAGLAASSKYNGALVLIAIYAAHHLRCGWKGLTGGKLYLALGSSAVAFIATNPFALLNLREVLGAVIWEARHYATGHLGMEGNTLRFYLTWLCEFEGPLCLLAVCQIIRGTRLRSKQHLLLSSFPVIYFAIVNSLIVRNVRTLLPILPFLFLLASGLLVNLFERAGSLRRKMRNWSVLGLAASTVLCLSWPLAQTVKNNIALSTVDSRTTSVAWIDRNLPEGARIAMESFAAYVDPERFSVQAFNKLNNHSPGWYVANGFDYLIFGENMFGEFYAEPNRYSEQVSRYDELFRTFEVVRIFTDGGYEVRIHRVSE